MGKRNEHKASSKTRVNKQPETAPQVSPPLSPVGRSRVPFVHGLLAELEFHTTKTKRNDYEARLNARQPREKVSDVHWDFY